jgi:hypothetical protein
LDETSLLKGGESILKKLSFSIDKFDLMDISNSELMKVRLWIVSEGDNLHERPISWETIESARPTLIGKPIVAKYNSVSQNLEGHEPDEVAVGVILSDDDIFYETDDSGLRWLCADGIIWVRYAKDVAFVLDRDQIKNLSMEIIVVESGEDNSIDSFTFSGITLIGTTPAIPNARVEVLSFSKVKENIEHLMFNFKIPDIVKQNAQRGLILKQHNSKGATAVNISICNQLISNEFASLELINNIYKFSQKAKTETARYLLGNVEAFEWADDILNSEDDFITKQFATDLGTEDSIEVNKSKEAMSVSSWGDVNKGSLREKILKAKNYKSLVKDVYMLVEEGWEDAPSEHLKYPVMQFKDGELVYNKEGLSSALTYAEGQSVTEVINKVNKIKKKLGLDEDKKEGEKMSKKEVLEKFSMTANAMRDMMDACVGQIKYQDGNYEYSKYWVSDYDNAYMYCHDSETGMGVAIPYQYAESEIQADFDNIKPARMAWIVDENDPDEEYMSMMMSMAKALMSKAGFTSDENTLAVAQAAMNEKEAEYNKKLAEMETNLSEMSIKYSEIEAQMSEASEKMSSMEEQMSVYMAENQQLKEEKMSRLEQEKMAQIEFTLQEVSDSMPKEKMEEMREEAKNFSYKDMNIWINKVKAEAFSFSKEKKNNDSPRMAFPWSTSQEDKDKNNVWNRI